MKTEEFDFTDFTRVSAGGASEVEVVQSTAYSISLTADDNLFKNLRVSKEGETLKVGRSKHISWRLRFTSPKVRIAMPVLNELRLSGASRGTVSGFSSAEDFKLKLSGASSVTGDITAGDAEFDLSGASKLDLTGSAKDVVIQGSGASHVELGGFSVHNVVVKLSGASRSTVKLEGTLNARLSGASNFSWIGNPIMGDIRMSGASKLSRK